MAEATLASIVVPARLGLRRDHVVPKRLRDDRSDAGYDFQTLVYDAVALPAHDAVWLFCPKLANFAAILRSADLTIDGRPVRPHRIRRFERYDIVEFARLGEARLFALALGDWRTEVALSQADDTTFAGANVLVTLSKDNDLRWIRDWARFHVREHGANAVLFFDNGSAEYGPAEIEAALSESIDPRAIRVVSAGFPYGPLGLRRHKFRENFLQAALLNLARWRFLDPARAVLQCDVDELVIARRGESIFDATVASPRGFVRIPGAWRFPAAHEGTPMHRDHYLTCATDRDSPPKYCILPRGPMRRKSWATHGLHGVLFGKRFVTDSFGYLHCYGISNFWKGRPASAAAVAGEIDPEARLILDKALG